MTNNTNHIYTAFDRASHGIRLVTIFPAADEDEKIMCELELSDLDLNPQYEALSYAWGDPSGEEVIFINGPDFRVMSNLFAALRRLRSPHDKRVLWIDALCINQHDDLEKSHQAQHVVVWLGDPLRDLPFLYSRITHLLELLALGNEYVKLKLVENKSSEKGSFEALKDIEEALGRVGSDLDKTFPGLLAWKFLPLFFLNNWWSCAWIVQEFVVAKSVYFATRANTSTVSKSGFYQNGSSGGKGRRIATFKSYGHHRR
ncbi:hypothetical protein MMC30_007367 [Trapelia coarctata]|nr:hypothetical protein [Trapelia coarctata]